jgi:uncharacterized repeat protein (TIGR03843 family)
VPARQRIPAPLTVTHPAEPVADPVRHALTEGELEISGRIMPASNATFYAEAVLGELRVPCVYKPTAGERPLWDFPDGTLAGRERAAYLVSEALGWDVVPLTLLRDGPAGPGMVQQWREPDPEAEAVDLCPPGDVPPGWLHVLDALDGTGEPVSLVHEDSAPLRRMAVFDVLVNNADRKGGHVLAMTGGHRYGVDHGICFHEDDKLRTVLWGWARKPLDPEDRAAVQLLGHTLGSSALLDELAALLTAAEVDALVRRAERLLSRNRMPVPSGAWPSIPWPAF